MPGFIPVTADHAADFAVGIDDGVDQEAGIDFTAGLDHVIIQWIVFDHEGSCLRIDAVAEFIS